MIELKTKDINGIEIQSSVKREKSFTLFSFNLVTKEIKKAVFLARKQDYIVTSLSFKASDIQVKYSLVKEPNCIYKQRLNVKSFRKHLSDSGLL
jgi:hypothetical protein